MIGIAFNLILIRVYRNRAAELNSSSVARDCPPASSLRFGVMQDRSNVSDQPTHTVFGDLESD
jgi:hypothetical protein